MSSGTRRKNGTFPIEFAAHKNSSVPYNVLSILEGEHSVNGGIMKYLNREEKNTLRLVSDATKKAVHIGEEYGYREIPITGPLSVWRRRFPKAKFANISGRRDLTDDDFKYLEGLEYLNMENCARYVRRRPTANGTRRRESKITDKAFIHLSSLKILNMSGCNARTITDKAFQYLVNVHTLYMIGCNQYISGNAFEYLTELKILDIEHCTNLGVNERKPPFEFLSNLESLEMGYCLNIKDKHFEPLKKLIHLNISSCRNLGINNSKGPFEHLSNLESLTMINCSNIKDEHFEHLKNLKTLYMTNCDQETITDNAFKNLKNLDLLDFASCNQETITNKAFENFTNIRTIRMAGCNQNTITDTAFMYLHNVQILQMQQCSQFTDDAFQNLANSQITSKNKLLILNINNCRQDTITGVTLTRTNFPKLEKLKINGCNDITKINAEINFGVTKYDSSVTPQGGGYTRKRKYHRRR